MNDYDYVDEHGFVIKDGVLEDYRGNSSVVRVPDGVNKISEYCMNKLFERGNSYKGKGSVKITRIILPDSIREFDGRFCASLDTTIDVNLPTGYLQQTGKLNIYLTLELLENQWKQKATIYDYASIYLFNRSQYLREPCANELLKTPNESAKVFIEILHKNGNPTYYAKAAEFIYDNKSQIDEETINEFYKETIEATAKKATQLSKEIATIDENGNQIVRGADTTNNPIEVFCHENFSEYYLDKLLRKAGISDRSLEGVLYKGSKDKVPAFVVKCIVAPYLELKDTYSFAYVIDIDFCENSDKVAMEVDYDSLITVLERIADLPHLEQRFGIYEKPECLIPLCRYGGAEHIRAISSAMNKWKDYGSSGKRAIYSTKKAILLNDSREAMIIADKIKKLGHYAKIRGVDEESIRDNQLSNFGLDKNGKKCIDIGSTTVDISIDKEMTITVYDNKAEKFVRAIPKRGADPSKYEDAVKDLADLKKNLKNVVKGQCGALFELFLNEKTRSVESWKSSYFGNPVLHRIAELIVWNQNEHTFTLTSTGIIDCHGKEYEIADEIPIGVAHPLMMQPDEIKSWQLYFTSSGIKQPFEQIWEPVVDPGTIRENRYESNKIPFFRFQGREKDGVIVDYSDEYMGPQIWFRNCKATVNRIGSLRIGKDEHSLYEVKSFSVSGRYTRLANHIVTYLDRITVYGRILNDDISVSEMFPLFTFAQLNDFLKLAVDNNATSVTASILEYKRTHYQDYNPMDEFVLG